MLLPYYFATDVERLIRSRKALASKQSDANSAEGKANSLEGRIDTLAEIELVRAESQEEGQQIQHDIEQLRAELKAVEKRRDRLKEEVGPLRYSFDTAVEFLQDTLEKTLKPAGLLGSMEDNSETATCSNEDIEEGSTAPTSVESMEPSPGELLGRVAEEELQQAQGKMGEARWQFDHRQMKYQRKLAKFKRLAAEGKVNSRSDFDRRQLQHEQGLTRKLIDAENSYELAMQQAKAIYQPQQPVNDHDEIYYNDGSILERQTKELCEANGIDRDRIEVWRSSLQEAQDPNSSEGEPVDIGNWTSNPIDVCNSISVVDIQGYGERREWWREQGRRLRAEQDFPSHNDEAWIPARSMNRWRYST